MKKYCPLLKSECKDDCAWLITSDIYNQQSVCAMFVIADSSIDVSSSICNIEEDIAEK